MQPPAPLGGMRFPVLGDLVGTEAAELESGQDNASRGVRKTLAEDPAGSCSVSFPSPHSSPSPQDHLLDHMYFAAPPSAAQEEVVETIFPSDILDFSSEMDDVVAVGDKPTAALVTVESKDSGVKKGRMKEKKTRRRQSANATMKRKRSRKDSSSSETTLSAAETDSAYDSPDSVSSPSSSSSSSSSSPSPKPALSSSNGLSDLSPLLSSTSSFHQPDIASPLRSSATSADVEDDLASTLDLDLLNSLLTKDILDEMGQVILDNGFESSAKEKPRSSDEDGPSDDAVSLQCGSESEDVFAGIFGDFQTVDVGDKSILNEFDSDEWESTFNEFFPMLA